MRLANGRRGGALSGPDEDTEGSGSPGVGRRAMLASGGAVVAGVVGAGLAAAVASTPASAGTTAVDQNTINDAGSSDTPTELDADNDTKPAFILTNTGVDTSDTTLHAAGPALRLTPSTEIVPTGSTAGGDLTATQDGNLWFTHDFPYTPPEVIAAPVHTEATSNVLVSLVDPFRVLDTRSADGRASIANPSGNLDSKGRLKAGKTIAVSLDSLAIFADAVLANLTVVGQAGSGYLIVWSGAGDRPMTSSINFPASGALSNFLSSGIGEYSDTALNAVAIYAEQTTHVILDVVAFAMPGFEYATFTAEAPNSGSRASRLLKAQQRLRNAKRS